MHSLFAWINIPSVFRSIPTQSWDHLENTKNVIETENTSIVIENIESRAVVRAIAITRAIKRHAVENIGMNMGGMMKMDVKKRDGECLLQALQTMMFQHSQRQFRQWMSRNRNHLPLLHLKKVLNRPPHAGSTLLHSTQIWADLGRSRVDR